MVRRRADTRLKSNIESMDKHLTDFDRALIAVNPRALVCVFIFGSVQWLPGSSIGR